MILYVLFLCVSTIIKHLSLNKSNIIFHSQLIYYRSILYFIIVQKSSKFLYKNSESNPKDVLINIQTDKYDLTPIFNALFILSKSLK